MVVFLVYWKRLLQRNPLFWQVEMDFFSNVTDFLASGTHFLSFSQTTVNFCLWKQFISQLEHIFQSILHSCWWKRVFRLVEAVLFYPEFFLLWKLLLKIGGSKFSKTKSPVFFYIFSHFTIFESVGDFSS